MDLPLIKEITIDPASSLDALSSCLKAEQLGQGPIYLNLSHLSGTHLIVLLTKIAGAIALLKINPRTPYPFYIITPEVRRFDPLLLLPDKSQIPPHYICKDHRTSKTEQSLLSKINISAQQISTHNLNDSLASLNNHKKYQRKLYNYCREAHFYHQIITAMKA